MEINTTLIVILAVLGVLALYAISAYNGLVHLKAMVDEGWSGIDVQLKRRYDLIPNLVATVKQYSIHEKDIFENIAKLRAASMGASTIDQKSIAETGLTSALKTLFAVAENYPELKANQNFMKLQEDLNNIENDIQLSRRYYNGAARNYNIGITVFPKNLIASGLGFKKAEYFELSNGIERENPQVKF